MKFFRNRGVAAVILVLAIAASCAYGLAKKPADTGEDATTNIVGSYTYVRDTQNVLSADTCKHIDAMNASLFAQTGAQIVVEVIDTTGNTEIGAYTEQEFNTLGVGSAERNNGVLILLALNNYYNGQPGGDYYMGWGKGLNSQGDALNSILNTYMEKPFTAGNYDEAVSQTFDALSDWFADYYDVSLKENYIPAVGNTYNAIGGGYSTETYGYVYEPSGGSLIGGVIFMLVVLFVVWMILDGMRYSRYRRRYMMQTEKRIPMRKTRPMI